jgi:Leucine-rich repeat (LRR) protein
MQDLREVDLGCNPVESIQGLQNLTQLQHLNLSGTTVSDLSPLEDCDFSEAYENGGLRFEIADIPAEDFSALSNIRQLRSFCPNNLDAGLWGSALENTQVFELSACGSFRDNESFAAFITAHPELERLDLSQNVEITDLVPVLSLDHLQYLKVSEDMEGALDAVRVANPGFEIEIQN